MRVYITGIGMVTPLGIGREETWNNILKGMDVEQYIPKNWHNFNDFSSNIWSPLPNIDYLENGFSRKELVQFDDTSLISLISAREAFEQAGLELDLVNKKRRQYKIQNVNDEKIAVVYGTSSGGAKSSFESYSYHINSKIKKELEKFSLDDSLLEKIYHPKVFNPMAVSRTICNSVPASLGIRYSVKGEVKPMVQACSSGTAAIGDAFKLIKNGKYDLVISGGAEQLGDDCGGYFYGFDSAKTLLKNTNNSEISTLNKPFDNNRNGFLFSQGGSCTLIIESEESIDKRKGVPLIEICGYEETFESYSLVAQNQDGEQIKRALNQLLNSNDLSPNMIDYINAHGTGTKSNDQVESMVLDNIFGKNTAINSTKSILGHTFGASGAIEAGICALSMRDSVLHKSKNIEDPILDLDFVREVRNKKINYAITQSFAFGGHIACLLLKNVR